MVFRSGRTLYTSHRAEFTDLIAWGTILSEVGRSVINRALPNEEVNHIASLKEGEG